MHVQLGRLRARIEGHVLLRAYKWIMRGARRLAPKAQDDPRRTAQWLSARHAVVRLPGLQRHGLKLFFCSSEALQSPNSRENCRSWQGN